MTLDANGKPVVQGKNIDASRLFFVVKDEDVVNLQKLPLLPCHTSTTNHSLLLNDML
jgi:hypothetical protein